MKILSSRSIKIILRLAPILYIGAVLYFWNIASGWEDRLSEDWAQNPLLSNASATLEYIKALVKTVILGSIAVIFILYLKRDADHDIKSNSGIKK